MSKQLWEVRSHRGMWEITDGKIVYQTLFASKEQAFGVAMSFNGYESTIEAVKKAHSTTRVRRVEVIEDGKHVHLSWSDHNYVSMGISDAGTTLRLFINNTGIPSNK